MRQSILTSKGKRNLLVLLARGGGKWSGGEPNDLSDLVYFYSIEMSIEMVPMVILIPLCSDHENALYSVDSKDS